MTNSGMLLRLSGTLRDVWRLRQRREGTRPIGTSAEAKPEHLYLRARALMRAGDLKMATSLFEEAAERDPTFSDAIEAQGELLDVLGSTGEAMAKYELARRVRGSIRAGAPDRHFVSRRRGSVIADILAYTSVIKSLRKYALPYLARGNAFLAGGQPEQALADYEHALRLNPKLLDAVALKGESLSAMGRFKEAILAFDRVLSGRPEDVDALNARGIAHMALGHVGEANADWRRQFELLHGRPAASAYVAMRLADFEAALPHLEAAGRIAPSDSYWALYRRTALLRLRRPLPPMPGGGEPWPGPLLAYQAGTLSADQVLARADTVGRRVETLFQLGLAEFTRNAAAAKPLWQQVVDQAPSAFVEYAAARNELARLAS